MIDNVFVSDAFKREAKRLVKKYVTLQSSIDKLIEDLSKNPTLGDAYGEGIYKIRLADKSKGRGKSGGFRVMYYHLIPTKNGIGVIMMSIFDKSEKGTIKKRDAINKLQEILKEHLGNLG